MLVHQVMSHALCNYGLIMGVFLVETELIVMHYYFYASGPEETSGTANSGARGALWVKAKPIKAPECKKGF